MSLKIIPPTNADVADPDVAFDALLDFASGIGSLVHQRLCDYDFGYAERISPDDDSGDPSFLVQWGGLRVRVTMELALDAEFSPNLKLDRQAPVPTPAMPVTRVS